MSRNLQNVSFNPLRPSNQFPRDFYDGNFVVPEESKRWMKENFPNSGLALFWPNHTGITMEGYQMMDVRAYIVSCNAFPNVWTCLRLHDT
jgi:hypothetical protein